MCNSQKGCYPQVEIHWVRERGSMSQLVRVQLTWSASSTSLGIEQAHQIWNLIASCTAGLVVLGEVKKPWTSKKAQQIKVFVIKPAKLTLVLRTHTVEGENWFLYIVLFPLSSTHAPWHMSPGTHIHACTHMYIHTLTHTLEENMNWSCLCLSLPVFFWLRCITGGGGSKKEYSL